MDYTYLDYFNYYLKEFLNELVSNYPETQSLILSNYRNLLEGRDDKNDTYVKWFYTKINNHLSQIAHKDATLFTTGTSVVFIEGVDLAKVWNSTNTTDANKQAIWRYLQILMIIGRKVIPNHKEIIDILNKIGNGEIAAPAKVERTLASETAADDDEKPSSVFGLGDLASGLGGLGGLASGLTSMLGGGGNGGEGLGGLMSGITEMLNNPEFTNAMSTLSQQMANMVPTTNGEDTPPASDTATADTTTTAQSTQAATPNSDGAAQEQQGQNPPPIFNNPLFSDLAKEISTTFNFEELNNGPAPANIGEVLGKFMSGNNPAKLMNLVGKFGSKLQNEVKSGNINPADLLKQTMGAAGGMNEQMRQAAEAVANNPQARAQLNRMGQQQATRDRLRAKLEKKRAAGEGGNQQ